SQCLGIPSKRSKRAARSSRASRSRQADPENFAAGGEHFRCGCCYAAHPVHQPSGELAMRVLGLDKANRNQGIHVIPAGTLVELVMKIKHGNIGIESLCRRTSKGDAEGLDVEYTVKGGEFDGRKLFGLMVLDGTSDGHAKAGEISRALLRAIYEAVHAIDPND